MIFLPQRLPRLLAPGLPSLRRYITEEALLKSSNLGEDNDVAKTGFIEKGQKESLLYFDKLTPIKSGSWDIRDMLFPLFVDVSEGGLKKRVLSLAKGNSADGTDLPLTISKFTPATRDGGAFVKFKVPDAMGVQVFNKLLIENVSKRSTGRLLDYLTHPSAFPVKGVPWIEDLARYPSPKLKVEFEGNDLTQENLYALFRRYGSIADIQPPVPGSAALPRHAMITFHNTRASVAARQCLNGFQAANTVLHIQYEKIIRENGIVQFINGHTRLFIPLFLAILAGLAVLIFDPIRHFFITEKITNTFSLQHSRLYKELAKKFSSTKHTMSRMLSLGPTFAEENQEWNSIEGLKAERDQLAKNIKISLDENVNSFIVVQGPPGTGKRSLVQEQALKGRDDVLYIDCEGIIKSRKESEFIKNTASQLGYFPVFPWLTSVSNFTDLIMQGLTGQKSGLNETKETQIKSILTLTADAIRDIALKNYSDSDDGEHHIKEEDYLRQNPGVKPVIVIDRFQAARNSRNEYAFIYKQLALWAASLVTLDIAHVIFITDDVGSIQLLSNALPTSPLRRTILSDATTSAAENYVWSKIYEPLKDADDKKKDESESEKAPDTTDLFKYTAMLGGRMLDLQMFVRRIQGGDSPKDAFDGLVQQAIEQVTQKLLQTEEKGFDRSQGWCMIKLLSKDGCVSFTDIQKLPLFKVNTYSILQSLENAELVSLIRDRGIIHKVKPSKPLYGIAFKDMVEDRTIYNSLESDYLKTMVVQMTAKVTKMEEEVARYRGLENSKMFNERLKYLANKIGTLTASITKWEKEVVELDDDDGTNKNKKK